MVADAGNSGALTREGSNREAEEHEDQEGGGDCPYRDDRKGVTMKPYKKRMARGAAALAMATGLVAVWACGTDQAAQQTGVSNSSNEAVPPFAPEVAEQPAANYAPNIDPSNFVDMVDNPYFPLKPGRTWVYEGKSPEGTERVEDTVLKETKQVMGVECVVLRDRVWKQSELVEETFDWHAQDKNGNVWYFGENSRETENGKLVRSKGSWEAGVDGAKPGIIMPADPKVGDSYREEYYPGHATDAAEVISLDGAELNDAVSTPYDSFSKNVLVTKAWNPLEPNILEHKYYVPGVGLIGEVKVTGPAEKVELVDFKPE
jgi:hypothetical protein